MSTEFFNDQWRIPSNENQNKVSNYSMDFDGTSDFIDCGDSDKFSFGDGTTDRPFSLSGWVKPDDLSTSWPLVSKSLTTGDNREYQFGIKSSKLSFDFNSLGTYTNRIEVDTTASITSTDWQHWVVTYDGSGAGTGVKIYVNGVEMTTSVSSYGTYVAMKNGTASFEIGAISNSFPSGKYANGKIDQVTVFDYALSPIQVASLGLDGYAFNFIPNDYIDFNNITGLNNLTAFSTSSWINYSGTPATSNIFLSGGPSLSNRFYVQLLSSTQIRYGSGSAFDNVSTSTISSGSWHHIVTVHNGTSLDVYLDGIKQNSSPVTVVAPNANIGDDFTIGRYSISPGYYWNGELSNISLWNTALTGPQVSTLYNNGKPGDISSLNPVAWYKLDNSELFNGAEWSIDNSKYPSVYKSSLNFSGNNQYLQVPDSNDFSFGNGTTDSPFSLSAWINPDAVEFAGIAAKYVTNGWEWLFYLTGSNELRLQLLSNNTSGNSITLTTDVAIPINTWTHVSATYNANGLPSGIDLYINGLPQSLVTEGGAGTYQAMTNTTAPLQIGTWAGSFRPINGQVSNVSIWDAELTQAQVSEIYNNGTPSNLSSHSATSNLISWWELDNTTTGLQDSKGSNNASNIGTTKYDGFVNTLAGDSIGMTSSSLVASDINGELIANPMITSPKPIAYYQLGDQSVSTGPTSDYLVPNNSLSDYVFDFGTTNESINLGSYFPYPSTVTDKWSFSCWIKLNSTSSYGYILSSYIPNANGLVVTLRGGADLGMVQATIRGQNSTQYAAVKTNNTLPLNEWKHVVATYDGNAGNAFTAFTIYINGNTQPLTPFGATSQSGSIINSYDKYIGQGAYGNPGSNYLTDCDLAQLSFFHYELSSSQVDTLYNNGAPGDISSLNPKRLYKLNASEVFNSTSTEWSVDNNAYPSVYQSSLNFDGSSDYIDTNSTFNTLTSFTVSAWFKADDTAGAAQGIASTRVNSIATSKGFDIFINSNVLTGRVYNNGATEILQSFTDTTSWHNVVMTYNGTTLELFLDNSSIGTATGNYDNSGGRNLTIGKWGPVSATPYYFDGQISNVAIWNTDLSSLEINTLYNNGTPEASISHSPVSWWKLNNTTTGIQDSAGSNDGTNNGATEYAGFVNSLAGESLGMNSANLVVSDLQQTSGYSPYALDFDGINDYLNCGNDSSLQITGAMTISYWVKGTSTFGAAGVGTLENSTSPGYLLGPSTTNTISFNIGLTSSSLFGVSTTQQITTTEWHHIVGVYTPSVSMKIYIDGQLSKTETSNIPSSQYVGGNDFRIGYRTCCKIDGQISNVAIWNTDLSSSEINEIYNEGVPSNLNNFSGTAPVSWWQLGSNSSFNTNWTCLDEIGTNNAVSVNMANNDIVDGVGYSASGLGTSSIDIKGDAPYSTANGLSENMDVLDRTLDTPITNTHSIQLDGIDDYIDFGNVNIFERTDAFSGSCWVFNEGASVNQYIIAKRNASRKGYVLYFNSSGALVFIMGPGPGSNISQVVAAAPSTNTWNHLAFTYDGSSTRAGVKLYVNGALQSLNYYGQSTITGTIKDPNTPFQISGEAGSTDNVLKGKVDEVAMFNSELSAPQVASIYNNGTPGNILPLNPVSWHRFESLTTNAGVVTTADSSGNGLTGTVKNGAVLSTNVP